MRWDDVRTCKYIFHIKYSFFPCKICSDTLKIEMKQKLSKWWNDNTMPDGVIRFIHKQRMNNRISQEDKITQNKAINCLCNRMVCVWLCVSELWVYIKQIREIETIGVWFLTVFTYMVLSISFQTFYVQVFKIVIDSWKFTMLLLYILWDDWPIFMISASNEQLQQQLEYTLLQPNCHSWWISKMQSGYEDTLEEQYAIKLF